MSAFLVSWLKMDLFDLYMWMQVERATLEKEMTDLGLDMTDKDEVRTCLLKAFSLVITLLVTHLILCAMWSWQSISEHACVHLMSL